MSPRSHSRSVAPTRTAPLFAALGNETRLILVAQLSRGQPRSISRLAADAKHTRQAITKHLRILETAGIVHGIRSGREMRFEFDPKPIEELKKYLDRVSRQWDQALARLKSYVER